MAASSPGSTQCWWWGVVQVHKRWSNSTGDSSSPKEFLQCRTLNLASLRSSENDPDNLPKVAQFWHELIQAALIDASGHGDRQHVALE